MPLFEITYTDPETLERKVVRERFGDYPKYKISAIEWAEDFAYALGGKRMDYEIEELDK